MGNYYLVTDIFVLICNKLYTKQLKYILYKIWVIILVKDLINLFKKILTVSECNLRLFFSKI